MEGVGSVMQTIKKSGIYVNSQKKRWEYWLVQENKIPVLVSWLSWSAPQSDYKKWVSTYTVMD